MGDLGKLILAKGFKICPKSNKSSNLVTLYAPKIKQQNMETFLKLVNPCIINIIFVLFLHQEQHVAKVTMM